MRPPRSSLTSVRRDCPRLLAWSAAMERHASLVKMIASVIMVCGRIMAVYVIHTQPKHLSNHIPSLTISRKRTGDGLAARFSLKFIISSSRASTRLRYVLFWFVGTPVTSPTWDVGVFLSRKLFSSSVRRASRSSGVVRRVGCVGRLCSPSEPSNVASRSFGWLSVLLSNLYRESRLSVVSNSSSASGRH